MHCVKFFVNSYCVLYSRYQHRERRPARFMAERNFPCRNDNFYRGIPEIRRARDA